MDTVLSVSELRLMILSSIIARLVVSSPQRTAIYFKNFGTRRSAVVLIRNGQQVATRT